MNYSSIGSYEYISIIGHYNKLTTKQKVDPRLLARGYSEEAIKMMYSKMDGGVKEMISLDVHFKDHLDKWNYPHFNYVMTLFDQYDRHGVLPFDGCHADQPSKILEVFQVLDQLKLEHKQKAQEEQQREADKKQRKNRKR